MVMEAISYSFAYELTTNYTVSKVLENGACREVTLGLRVPDGETVTFKNANMEFGTHFTQIHVFGKDFTPKYSQNYIVCVFLQKCC